jgi:hypothetical protein
MVAVEDFQWLENSKEMFDKVAEASPWFVRHFTKSGMLKGLHEKGVKDVTESAMYDVCKEVTPSKYLPQTLEVLDGLKTT